MIANRTSIKFITASLIVAMSCALLNAESQHTVNITPRNEDNFVVASFSYLVPQPNNKPRYILVLVPGFNGNGERFLQHQQWRTLAETTGGAILACTFKALPEETPEEIDNYVHYAAAQHGSGAALESAIDQFDAMDPMHSLKDLPLLIYGHSAGGQFAYGFTCHNPKRMIGFAAAKGGYYYPEPVKETYKVPGLLISGEQDLERRRKEIRALFESHRKHGAPWCWMEDAYGHGTANTLEVIIPYFKELLKMRLNVDSKALNAISKDDGTSVNLQTKTIVNEDDPNAGKSVNLRTGFLPSMNVFKTWVMQDNGNRKYLRVTDQADDQ